MTVGLEINDSVLEICGFGTQWLCIGNLEMVGRDSVWLKIQSRIDKNYLTVYNVEGLITQLRVYCSRFCFPSLLLATGTLFKLERNLSLSWSIWTRLGELIIWYDQFPTKIWRPHLSAPSHFHQTNKGSGLHLSMMMQDMHQKETVLSWHNRWI